MLHKKDILLIPFPLKLLLFVLLIKNIISHKTTEIFKQYFILLVMALRNDQFRFEKYNLWPGCPVAFVTKSLRSVATPRRPVLSSE